MRGTALLAVALLAAPAWGQQTLELRGGQWVETSEATTAPAAAVPSAPPNPALDEVRRLIDRDQGKAAFHKAVHYLTTTPRTEPGRDRALLLTAQALYSFGNRIKAFYYLDELMDTYPSSGYYADALRLQYDIADAYLDGYKSRVLGIPLLTQGSEAVEMLFRIQQRAPGSPLAEQSLLRTADFYYNDGQYDLAADTYAAFLRSYPRSPRSGVVRLRQAFANLAQFRGLRFDPTPAIDARAQLVALADIDPPLAKQYDVPGLITRIDRALAGKEMLKADFYQRIDEPTAAARLYTVVETSYPTLPESKDAAARLAKLDVPAEPDKSDDGVPPPLPSQRFPLVGPDSNNRAPGRRGPADGSLLGPDPGIR